MNIHIYNMHTHKSFIFCCPVITYEFLIALKMLTVRDYFVNDVIEHLDNDTIDGMSNVEIKNI